MAIEGRAGLDVRMAVEALRTMEARRVTSLIVTDDRRIAGVVHLHDLWRTDLF